MKRRKNSIVQLCVLGVLGAAVVCTLLVPYLSAHFRRKEPLEVSVILGDPDGRLWSGTRMGMEQAASDLGVELRFLSPTSASAAEQEELIRKELERVTDAPVITPVDSSLLEENLHFGEMPVIAMESPIGKNGITVSPDNRQIGKQLAQLALQEGKGEPVLLISSYAENRGTKERMDAAAETLNQAGVKTEKYCGVDFAEIYTAAQEMGAKQLIALDSKATLLAAQGFGKLHVAPHLYGVGSAGEITAQLEKGVLSAVAAWSEYAAGYMAVENAAASIEGNPSRSEGTLKMSVIRKDEIYEPDNQKLLFPIIS